MYESVSYPETFTLDWFNSVYKLLNDGKLSIEDYKSSFNYVKSKKNQISQLLNEYKKDQLLKMVGGMTAYRLKSEKKEAVVNGVYDSIVGSFALGGISYSPFSETYEQALERKINVASQDDLRKYANEIERLRLERIEMIEKEKKALDNPETIEEFKIFIHKKGKDALSVDQKRLYDSLISGKVIEKREQEFEKKAEIKKVEGLESEMKLIETVHTRDKYPLFVVQLADRVSKEQYQELNNKAKKLGGWYSSFRGGGAVAGFQFKEKAQAEKFMLLKEEDVSDIEKKKERQEVKLEKRADKLRSNANSLIEKAEESLSQERLTNTYKRAQQASSADERAREEKRIAKTMINIADAIDSGEAKYLDNISAKTHIELLDLYVRMAKRNELNEKYKDEYERRNRKEDPATVDTIEYIKESYFPKIYVSTLDDLINKAGNRSGGKLIANRWEKKIKGLSRDDYYKVSTENEMEEIKKMFDSLFISDKKYNRIHDILINFSRLKAMKIENDSMLREVLREYVKYRGGMEEVNKVKELERKLAGSKVGFDYFPTPKPLAEEMVDTANISEGMSVLEPSAGNGNIADAIKNKTGISPDVIEISSQLREILEAKGYSVVANDFDTFADKKYDRIIMNPPFSNGMDADHIKHAYSLLKEDGRIVAISGEGIFFRTDKKAQDFRDWLNRLEHSVEKLPEKTFTDKSLYATTGANARLIIIDKPIEIKETTKIEVKEDSGKQEWQEAISTLEMLIESGGSKEEISEWQEAVETLNILLEK